MIYTLAVPITPAFTSVVAAADPVPFVPEHYPQAVLRASLWKPPRFQSPSLRHPIDDLQPPGFSASL